MHNQYKNKQYTQDMADTNDVNEHGLYRAIVQS